MNRIQAAQQLRRALQIFASSLSDEKAMEIPAVFDPWNADKNYAAGDFLTYGENGVGDPQLYKVVQAHTSQADWMPDATPALYAAVGLDEKGYPVWSQPAGAHDAYNIGDIVGGISNSRHLTGKAMDFCVTGKSAEQVLAYVKLQPEINFAYAIDSENVHMDIL